MAAVFQWCEDNGALSSGHGTTRNGFGADTNYPIDVNWKNVDDTKSAGSGTLYSASPVGPPPANGFTKYQYGHFVSGFNQISAGLYAHTANAFNDTNTVLKGTVTTTYATPSATTNAALTTDMSTAIAIASGLTVLFHLTGPEGASPTATLAAAGYTQYLATQLQLTSGVTPGDTPSATMTLQYNEN